MAHNKKTKKKTDSKVRINTYVDMNTKNGIAEIANLLNRSENYVANEAYKAYINANLDILRQSAK